MTTENLKALAAWLREKADYAEAKAARATAPTAIYLMSEDFPKLFALIEIIADYERLKALEEARQEGDKADPK